MMPVKFPKGYVVSSQPALLNIEVIHRFIAQAYRAKAIPKPLVGRMIQDSLCRFGFKAASHPERRMKMHHPGMYERI